MIPNKIEKNIRFFSTAHDFFKTRRLKNMILPLIIFFSSIGQADSITDISIQLTIKNKNIAVNYRRMNSKTPVAIGTMFFLCGGPGAPCTSYVPPNLPADSNYITFDYLGLGINSSITDTSLLDIETQGAVAAGIISLLSDKNIIIYSQSFGTTVATVAASILSQNNNTNLKGVLLEGTVGKGLVNYGLGFVGPDNFAWSQLTEQEQNDFKTVYVEFSKNLTQEQQLGLNIYLTTLSFIDSESAITSLRYFSSTLKYEDHRNNILENIQINLATIKKFSAAPSAFAVPACQIFNPNENVLAKIYDGLVPVETGIRPGICDKVNTNSVWNPERFQINKIPLFYVQGMQDPATPFAGAKAHFEAQLSSNKIMITSQTAGHGLLMDSENLSACSDFFFRNLALQRFDLIKERASEISAIGCGKIK